MRDAELLNLRHSIIRRSAAVTTAFAVGHGFNYALMWGANHLLDSGGFGLFYTSLLIVNVLLSPIMAVMLVLVRRLAVAGARQGRAEVAAMTWRLLGDCLRALPVIAVLALLLAAAAGQLGFEAWPIALLIPLTVLALVVTEILRASFQGMLLFGWQNALWIVSTGAQFAFATAALWFLPRVWTGIAGVLAGAVVASAAFIPWFGRAKRAAAAPPSNSATVLDLSKEWPMLIGYSLFILLNNVDILVAYWLLPRAELDAYAASSLLPKAITTMTFAVAQVMLPVIVDQKADGISFRRSIVKAVAMTVGIGVAAAAILWIAVPWLQGTPLAIRRLDIPTMMTLAFGAVALGAVRVLVVIDIALQRHAVAFAQGAAIIVFTLVCLFARVAMPGIAEIYALVTCSFTILIAVALLAPRPVFAGLFQSHAR